MHYYLSSSEIPESDYNRQSLKQTAQQVMEERRTGRKISCLLMIRILFAQTLISYTFFVIALKHNKY